MILNGELIQMFDPDDEKGGDASQDKIENENTDMFQDAYDKK